MSATMSAHLDYRQLFQPAALPAATYVELVRLLYGSFIPAATIGLATAGIALLVAVDTGDGWFQLLWPTTIALTAARISLVILFRRMGQPAAGIVRWERRYAVGSLLFSVLLGLTCARMFVLDDPMLQMLATAVLFAYSSGLLMRLYVRPAICVGTLLVAGVPVIIAVLMREELVYFALAALMIMMIIGGLETAFHMFSNLLSQVATRQKFEMLATRDALTGLPNRLLLDETVQVSLAASQREGKLLALHALDLDKFKAANDKYGHPVGDAILVEVARRLLVTLRQGDSAARLGGDEFVVIQPHLSSRDEASVLARRLIQALSAPYQVGAQVIIIGVSIGIAMAPTDAIQPHHLLAAADAALYASKAAGQGQASFYETMAAAILAD